MRANYPPLVLVIALIFPASAGAAVRYVNAAATGANNGTSWADAYTDLQSALTVAVDGDEIWVAEGTYKPSIQTSPPDSRSATFAMVAGVTLYGGFAGYETSSDQRNPQAHPTVLSGDLAGDDATTGGKTDNAYHVVSRTIFGGNTNLVSFTIQGGWADGASSDQCRGAGVYLTSGHLGIFDCCIVANYASYYGGGVYQSNSGSGTVFEECRFEDNNAPHGGGMCISSSAYCDIRDCSFVNNTATSALGGAIYQRSASVDPTIVTRCLFENNTSQQSGGAIFSHCANRLDIADSVFTLNACYDPAGEGGGAVYNNSLFLHMSNCILSGNTSPRAGAVHLEGTRAAIVNCKFLQNQNGYAGGGLYNRVTNATVTNCLFASNSAYIGGGAYDSDSNVSYTNCTFADNTASLGGGGLGIADTTGTKTSSVANSIFWGNSDSLGSGENSQINIESGTAVVNYNCVQGWTGAIGGTGNVGSDPLFVGGDGLYHVQDGSPTIDAGDNSLVPADSNDLDDDSNTTELTPLDLDLGPRFVNTPTVADTGAGTSPIVDMGCYEFMIDCDGNGLFDACDLSCGESGGPCDLPGCGQEPDCNANGAIDACELDTDGDGLIDDCDDDDDDDGLVDANDNCRLVANPDQADTDADTVGDACDVCPETLPGLSVDAEGCPPDVPGDMDRDGDVDMEDFGAFQACLTGTGVQIAPTCERAKLNGDDWVNWEDAVIFQGCMSGSRIAGNPACAN